MPKRSARGVWPGWFRGGVFAIGLLNAACGATPARGTHPIRSESSERLPGTSVCVVATIHSFHLVQRDYPLDRLARVMDAFSPDLVLVEVRPEAFAARHFEDGPFEMTYVTSLAEHRGIAVEPIDWWLESDVASAEPTLTSDVREAYERERRSLEAAFVWPPSFEVANSPEQAATVLALHNVEARYLNGSPVWARRQSWFHARALAAIERHHARRVLAFVGEEHRAELALYLDGFGARRIEPLSFRASMGSVDPGARVPDDVVASWREGVERMRAAVASQPENMRAATARKIRYFEIAIERAGACCVEPSALAVPAASTAP